MLEHPGDGLGKTKRHGRDFEDREKKAESGKEKKVKNERSVKVDIQECYTGNTF